MATTYTWQISLMECYPEQDGYTDVVFSAFWTCYASDTVNKIFYTSNILGKTDVTLNPDAPYIPYQNLTEQQVLNWVWTSGVNKNEIEIEADIKLQALLNPAVITPPLPWLPTPTPTL